jgi:hypothetical protein
MNDTASQVQGSHQNFYKKKEIPQYCQSQTSLHNYNTTSYPISYKMPTQGNERNDQPELEIGFTPFAATNKPPPIGGHLLP